MFDVADVYDGLVDVVVDVDGVEVVVDVEVSAKSEARSDVDARVMPCAML